MNYASPTQYMVVKDGNLYVSYRHRDPATYQIECKFGQPVGASWEVRKAGQLYTYSIDSLNAKVKTGRGLVTDAIKVKLTPQANTSQTTYQYVSPSVGILGDGNFGSTASMQLKDYSVSTTTSTAPATLPISFGNFPFMKVGNFWRYNLSYFGGESEVIRLDIVSKLANLNVYQAKLTYESTNESTLEYWYEDQGRLMVYESGETLLQADPIYITPTKAAVGHGWTGTTSRGTTFISKISALSSTQSTFYGQQSCMSIDVSSGVFSAQTNHWNTDKGLVLVDGLMSQEIISTNVRKSPTPVVPFCGI